MQNGTKTTLVFSPADGEASFLLLSSLVFSMSSDLIIISAVNMYICKHNQTCRHRKSRIKLFLMIVIYIKTHVIIQRFKHFTRSESHQLEYFIFRVQLLVPQFLCVVRLVNLFISCAIICMCIMSCFPIASKCFF